MAYNDFQSKNRDNAVRDAAGRAEGKKYQFAFFFLSLSNPGRKRWFDFVSGRASGRWRTLTIGFWSHGLIQTDEKYQKIRAPI